jgi:hypothetical protein
MDIDSTSTEPAVDAPADPKPHTIDVNAQEVSTRSSGASRGLLVAIAFGVVAVLAMQIFVLISMSQTDEQITALEGQVVQLRLTMSNATWYAFQVRA